MKRVLTLLLAIFMVISMAACGEKTTEPDSPNMQFRLDPENVNPDNVALDAERAIAETPFHIYRDAMEDMEKTKQNTYIMKVYPSIWYEPGVRFFDCSTEDYVISGVRVYLSEEEISKVTQWEEITIIGRVTGLVEQEINYEDGDVSKETYVAMGKAELYEGEVPEVAPREYETAKGVLLGRCNEYSWAFRPDGYDEAFGIAFEDEEDLSAFNGLPENLSIYSNDLPKEGIEITIYQDAVNALQWSQLDFAGKFRILN